jgi:hypothetical protein
MATNLKRLPARTSDTLRATVDQAGPISAATRALLWLGADAAGLTIPAAGRREIAALLVEVGLTPTVLAALQQLYDRLADTRGGDTPGDTPGGTPGDTPRRATTRSIMPAVPAVPQPERLAADRSVEAARDDPFADVGMEFEGS